MRNPPAPGCPNPMSTSGRPFLHAFVVRRRALDRPGGSCLLVLPGVHEIWLGRGGSYGGGGGGGHAGASQPTLQFTRQLAGTNRNNGA